MFLVELSSKSKQFLKKVDSKLRNRILQKIKLLKINPVLSDSKKIIGDSSVFRIRVGNYRILYEIKWSEKIILIVIIDKRSRVYNR